MKTKQKTKREIILETANAYTSNTRSVSFNDQCAYKAGAYKCAVGRCLLAKSKLFNKSNIIEPITNINCNINDELKSEYRGHSIEFWMDVQALHDIQGFWDKNGITEYGKREIESLLNVWGEDND
jgi:hypothetical protein